MITFPKLVEPPKFIGDMGLYQVRQVSLRGESFRNATIATVSHNRTTIHLSGLEPTEFASKRLHNPPDPLSNVLIGFVQGQWDVGAYATGTR